MISQFDVPAWGYFDADTTCHFERTWGASFHIESDIISSTVHCDEAGIPALYDVPYLRRGGFSAESPIYGGAGFSYHHTPNVRLNGWFSSYSVIATVEGYNYLPISYSLETFWLNEISAFFVDGENFCNLGSPGYQYKLVDSSNSVESSDYKLHFLSDITSQSLPKIWTSDSFSGWDLQGKNVSGSFVSFLARTFEQVEACLAILSGGTVANYGRESTSERVYSAVTESTSLTEDGEGVSVSERLARIESAVSQLIALTTYSYYISGASVDSAPASGQSVAEGVLNYLKLYLGGSEGEVNVSE